MFNWIDWKPQLGWLRTEVEKVSTPTKLECGLFIRQPSDHSSPHQKGKVIVIHCEIGKQQAGFQTYGKSSILWQDPNGYGKGGHWELSITSFKVTCISVCQSKCSLRSHIIFSWQLGIKFSVRALINGWSSVLDCQKLWAIKAHLWGKTLLKSCEYLVSTLCGVACCYLMYQSSTAGLLDQRSLVFEWKCS